MTPEGLARLCTDEGLRLAPYRDTRGFLTIGYGRCLDRRGISEGEATMMLDNDIAALSAQLGAMLFFRALDPVRQDVMLNLAYNLGIAGLLGFRRMIGALDMHDWNTAAAELLDSAAARELPVRYHRLADALIFGFWPS